MRRLACAMGLALSALACGRVITPPRGGEPELKLVMATARTDIPAVKQMLAAGANPNAMVTYEGA